MLEQFTKIIFEYELSYPEFNGISIIKSRERFAKLRIQAMLKGESIRMNECYVSEIDNNLIIHFSNEDWLVDNLQDGINFVFYCLSEHKDGYKSDSIRLLNECF